MALVFIIVCITTSRLHADLRLPAILSDHMVLQQQAKVAIWGWADPGERVTVSISKQSHETKTDTGGRWRVILEPMPATDKPQTLAVSTATGESITIKDVLVGEVWLCAGQSNMDFKVTYSENREEAVANADLPTVRVFGVNQVRSAEPQDNLDGQWKRSDAASVLSFTAVGYYFGRELNRELDVPIGLIHDAWGGTRIEAWMPLIAFETNPILRDDLNVIRADNRAFAEAKKEAVSRMASWLEDANKAISTGSDIPAPPAWPTSKLAEKNKPTSIYNAMLNPLTPFTIRGVTWYQGESNNGDGQIYRDRMESMILSWRQLWDNPDLPFYYVQIAPYKYGGSLHPADALPWMWEAQRQILKMPNTGMAVITDISDTDNLHPRNKLEVGKRLAYWALARTYGRDDVACSGPLYRDCTIVGDSIRIVFDYADGLASRDGEPLNWFAIAGEDRRFVEAYAEIDGNSVVVHSAEVARPVAVRFAWEQTAQPNLVNGAGLPASSFRTDAWPYEKQEQ
ncbi:MAG: sialate O-acetylesterase [Phycisphaerales bacterium]